MSPGFYYSYSPVGSDAVHYNAMFRWSEQGCGTLCKPCNVKGFSLHKVSLGTHCFKVFMRNNLLHGTKPKKNPQGSHCLYRPIWLFAFNSLDLSANPNLV